MVKATSYQAFYRFFQKLGRRFVAAFGMNEADLLIIFEIHENFASIHKQREIRAVGHLIPGSKLLHSDP